MWDGCRGESRDKDALRMILSKAFGVTVPTNHLSVTKLKAELAKVTHDAKMYHWVMERCTEAVHLVEEHVEGYPGVVDETVRETVERLSEDLRIAKEALSNSRAAHSYAKLENVATTDELTAAKAELAEALKDSAWQTGIPDVPEGKQRRFWCAVNNGHYYKCLLYSNRFVSPASDDAEPTEGTEANDDGDYYWTGWFEEACDQCDTFWSYSGTVNAWMKLPKYPDAAVSQEARK